MAGGRAQRWIARLGLRSGLAPKHFALLETTGRRTGRQRQTRVGGAVLGPAFWVVAEHGTDCRYVKKLTSEPLVRVKVRRTRRTGRATVVADDDATARHREITAANGWVGSADGVIFRASATTPASIRIDLD